MHVSKKWSIRICLTWNMSKDTNYFNDSAIHTPFSHFHSFFFPIMTCCGNVLWRVYMFDSSFSCKSYIWILIFIHLKPTNRKLFYLIVVSLPFWTRICFTSTLLNSSLLPSKEWSWKLFSNWFHVQAKYVFSLVLVINEQPECSYQWQNNLFPDPSFSLFLSIYPPIWCRRWRRINVISLQIERMPQMHEINYRSRTSYR